MYYFIKGIVYAIEGGIVVVDVNGVGYGIQAIHPEKYQVGEESLIYTHYVVKEDEQFLVGFESLKEKEVFLQLISVNGIGPKTALNALKEISVETFLSLIEKEDIKGLTKLPGIGKKSASQIILDLKGKLFVVQSNRTMMNKNKEDAKQALKSLGFKSKEVDDILVQIEDESLSVEAYVSEALKLFRK